MENTPCLFFNSRFYTQDFTLPEPFKNHSSLRHHSGPWSNEPGELKQKWASHSNKKNLSFPQAKRVGNLPAQAGMTSNRLSMLKYPNNTLCSRRKERPLSNSAVLKKICHSRKRSASGICLLKSKQIPDKPEWHRINYLCLNISTILYAPGIRSNLVQIRPS